MGHVFAEIELSNPRQPELLPIRAKALADTGRFYFWLDKYPLYKGLGGK